MKILAAHALSCYELPKTITSISGMPNALALSHIGKSLMKTWDAQAGTELALEGRVILPRNENPSSVAHQLDADSTSSCSWQFSYVGSRRTLEWMKAETFCSEVSLDLVLGKKKRKKWEKVLRGTECFQALEQTRDTSTKILDLIIISLTLRLFIAKPWGSVPASLLSRFPGSPAAALRIYSFLESPD